MTVKDARLKRLRTAGIIAAAVGAAGTGALALLAPEELWSGYLFAFVACWGLAGGSLGILLLHHLVGGGWGFLIQRILEAAAKTFGVVAVMFVPILFGLHDLYHWSHADEVAKDELLRHKSPYLNVTAFVVRAAVYLVILNGLAWSFARWSRRLDETGDVRWLERLKAWAGPGLVLFILTTTFAAFDWSMSLDPHWFSTIYGLIFAVTQALSALALSIVVLAAVRRGTPLDAVATADRAHDLGKLLFAFTMLWGYVQFSQFLIIWYGNLPEEIIWYVQRSEGGYLPLSIGVALLHLVLPFFVLLSARPKRDLDTLSKIAGAFLVVVWVGWFWMVIPGPLRAELAFAPHDLASLLLLGGVWLTAFAHFLGGSPLLAQRDPRTKEALGDGTH